MEPKLFNAQEFSDLTGVPRGTLRRWKHEKKLTPIVVGGATKPNYYSESQIPIAIQLFQMASKTRRENSSMNNLFSSEEDIKNMETSQNPTFDNHNDDREEEIPAVIPTDDDDADDDELIDPPIINATEEEILSNPVDTTTDKQPVPTHVISLDGDDTVSLEERANRIRKLQADVQRGIIQIGLELAAAKKEVGHGNWADWLKKEFAWSQRTASYFMAIAERFSNSHTYSNLKPSTLKAMLALPEGDEDAFIEEQAKSGKPVETQTAREVQASIKHWKQNRHKEKQDSIQAANSTPIPVDDEKPTDEVKGTYVNLTGKPANDVVADELNAQATKSPSPTKPTIDAQTPAVDAPRRLNDATNIEPNNLSLQREKALEAIRELIITKAESATDLSALRNALTLVVEIIDTELSKN